MHEQGAPALYLGFLLTRRYAWPPGHSTASAAGGVGVGVGGPGDRGSLLLAGTAGLHRASVASWARCWYSLLVVPGNRLSTDGLSIILLSLGAIN